MALSLTNAILLCSAAILLICPLQLCALSQQPSVARKPRFPRYVLKQSPLQPQGMLLCIYDSHHKVVWTSKRSEVISIDALKWSHSRHSLAFMERRFGSTGLRLVIWNVQGPICQYEKPLALFHDEANGTKILWSSDDRRLLLRTVSGGDMSANTSTAWCLNLATGQVQQLPFHNQIRRAKWIGSQQVRYWIINSRQSVKDSRKGNERNQDGLMFAEVSQPRDWSCR